MKICLIWAQDRAGAIGKAGTLPWHLPEDLKHFKEATLGCPVIMGRKTFESLPKGALPGRLNIVLTRDTEVPLPGAIRAQTLNDAIALAGSGQPAKAYIIGGESLYRLALSIADQVEVTEIDTTVQGADTFAPVVPQSYNFGTESPWHTSVSGLKYRHLKFFRNHR